MPKDYDAFITYQNGTRETARAVWHGLRRLGRPWHTVRPALKVFLDEENVGAGPLPSQLVVAVKQSNFLIVIASPGAATAKWVNTEIQAWRDADKPASHVSVVLCEGDLAWSDEAGDFDRQTSTALPYGLLNYFEEQPKWVDVRELRRQRRLTLADPDFMNSVAEVAYRMHGLRDKGELVGEDVRQRARLRWASAVGVAVFLGVTGFAAWKSTEAAKERELTRIAAAEAQVREGARESQVGRRSYGLARFAQALRTHGQSAPARTWITGQLTGRTWALPLATQPLPANALRAALSGPNPLLLATSGTTAWVWDFAGEAPRLVVGPVAAGQRDVYGLLSADGSTLLLRSPSGVLAIDLRTGRSRALPDALRNFVAMGPDGATILTHSDRLPPRQWRLDDAEGREIPLPPELASFSYDPSGTRFVSASRDGTVTLWDAANLAPLARGKVHQGGVPEVHFSPDGTALMSIGWDGRANILRPAGGTFRATTFSHSDRQLVHAAWHPGGEVVATASMDGTTILWDTDGDRLGVPMVHEMQVSDLEFSPEGSRLVTASADETVRLWNARDGVPIAEPIATDKFALGAGFRGGPDRVVTVSVAEATVWALPAPPRVEIHVGRTSAVGARFSPDGSRLVLARRDGHAEVVESVSGRQLALLEAGDRVHWAEFDAPGTRIVAAAEESAGADGSAVVFDLADGSRRDLPHEGPARLARFSPDGSRVVTVGFQSARIWHLASGDSHDAKHEDDWAVDAAFSPDGSRAAAVWRNTWRLWRADRGWRASLRESGPWMTALAWHPDGTRVAIGRADGSVALREVAAPNKRLELAAPRSGAVLTVVFSRDGERVAVAWGDGVAQSLRTADGQPLGQQFRYDEGIKGKGFSPDGQPRVAFSPDRKRLATVGRSGNLRLWESDTGRQIGGDLSHKGELLSVAFSPDGQQVAIGGWVPEATIWQTPDGSADSEADLAELADAVAGHTVQSDGTVRIMNTADRIRSLIRLRSSGSPFVTRFLARYTTAPQQASEPLRQRRPTVRHGGELHRRRGPTRLVLEAAGDSRTPPVK
jgi:WD40 repeat protein